MISRKGGAKAGSTSTISSTLEGSSGLCTTQPDSVSPIGTRLSWMLGVLGACGGARFLAVASRQEDGHFAGVTLLESGKP